MRWAAESPAHSPCSNYCQERQREVEHDRQWIEKRSPQDPFVWRFGEINAMNKSTDQETLNVGQPASGKVSKSQFAHEEQGHK